MNTLGDLNAFLFESLERLNNDELKGEELKEEMERSKAISGVAKDIVSNANLVLQAQRFANDQWDAEKKVPRMLEG